MEERLALFLLVTCLVAVQFATADVTYDFEDGSTEIPIKPTVSNVDPTATSASLLTRTPTTEKRYKHGEQSLKWQWSGGTTAEGETLTWSLTAKNIKRRSVRYGGIKFHVYSTHAKPNECLKMCINQEETIKSGGTSCPAPGTTDTYTSCFHMSLDFKGWRAVWVSYDEFRGCPNTNSIPAINCLVASRAQIQSFTIEAPKAATSHAIYIDYLRFVDTMEDATRDKIVPPIKKAGTTICHTCSQFSSVREKDAVHRHDQTHVWDQAYRWDIKERASASSFLPATADNSKLRELLTIKKRLLDWYGKSETSFFDLVWSSSTPTRVSTRWDGFLNTKRPSRCNVQSGTIQCAHKIYHGLGIEASSLKGPGLYCRNSKPLSAINDENLLGDIFHKVLLPLAVEYHIWSNVNTRACVLAKKYHCGITDKNILHSTDLDAITGKDSGIGTNNLEQVFDTAFGSTALTPSSTDSSFCPTEKQNCVNRFKTAIEAVNIKRKQRILLLFKYIRDQGFAEGSSLGSLGHQMLVGSGYMHAAFLMAETIDVDGGTELTLQNILDTMKWFTDFGELYQTTYEYKGTTADRVRTFMLFRLLTVLSMPETNDNQKKKKIRDMQKLKEWIDNALSPNEGTFGLLKPDSTGFHHQFFYAGAYLPSAMHTASLIAYLLDGNPIFQLSDNTKTRIENALKLLRKVAVKYSTPSSVNGRYPDYKKSQLLKELPAFAYIAVDPPLLDSSDNLLAITLKTDKSAAKMFKRLLPSSPMCSGNLCNGKTSSITFLNTLGTAQILDKVENLINSVSSITAEDSPSGNWAKNYAALSIHRRDDWAVTVKGFNHRVFDPERYVGENEYGLYGAHGAILIANSEDALDTKNVNVGWDWKKIPGTTTVSITDAEIKNVTGSRKSNGKELAGGVTFRGKNLLQENTNGVFGMDFEMPAYKYRTASGSIHPLDGKTFEFKKSVFFFDDVLVCVGSGISSTAAKKVTTALFQDTVIGTPSATISASPRFYCNEGTVSSTKDDFSGEVKLIDRHGNRYYIPATVSDDLVLHRQTTQSTMPNKGSAPTTGTYCTAYLDHGTPRSIKNYNYFVQVNAVPSPHDGSSDTTSTEIDLSKYEILQPTSKAVHTVKKTISSTNHICGYIVFDEATSLDANCPLLSADTKCIIMAEKTSSHLYISVSYPQMNLQTEPPPSHFTDINPNFCSKTISASPVGSADRETSLLFCAKDQGKDIVVQLRGTMPTIITSVLADGHTIINTPSTPFSNYAVIQAGGIKFLGLKHGKTIEISLQ